MHEEGKQGDIGKRQEGRLGFEVGPLPALGLHAREHNDGIQHACH